MADIENGKLHGQPTSDDNHGAYEKQYQAIVESAADFGIIATDRDGLVTA